MKTKSCNIFLAGGGNAEESQLLDVQFVKMLDLAKPVVYVPNAIAGYSIVCHYKPEHDAETRKLSKIFGQSLIAIPENTGGHVAGNSITAHGTEPIFIFGNAEVETVSPLGATTL